MQSEMKTLCKIIFSQYLMEVFVFSHVHVSKNLICCTNLKNIINLLLAFKQLTLVQKWEKSLQKRMTQDMYKALAFSFSTSQFTIFAPTTRYEVVLMFKLNMQCIINITAIFLNNNDNNIHRSYFTKQTNLLNVFVEPTENDKKAFNIIVIWRAYTS